MSSHLTEPLTETVSKSPTGRPMGPASQLMNQWLKSSFPDGVSSNRAKLMFVQAAEAMRALGIKGTASSDGTRIPDVEGKEHEWLFKPRWKTTVLSQLGMASFEFGRDTAAYLCDELCELRLQMDGKLSARAAVRLLIGWRAELRTT